MPVTDFQQLTVGNVTARAYLRVAHGARIGVVVLHAWWGLNEDAMAYADRLADVGFAVIAPDMFRGQVATTAEEAERLSQEGDDGIAADVAWAAIDRLAAEVPDAPLATLGWSFGASYATMTVHVPFEDALQAVRDAAVQGRSAARAGWGAERRDLAAGAAAREAGFARGEGVRPHGVTEGSRRRHIDHSSRLDAS